MFCTTLGKAQPSLDGGIQVHTKLQDFKSQK